MHSMPAGVGLCLEDKDGCVKVVKVLKGSSAYAKGIAEGDRLLRVDGISVNGMSAESVARTLIVGDINSAVRIEIIRENDRFSDVIRTLLFRKVLNVDFSSATVDGEYNSHRRLSPHSQIYESQSSSLSCIQRTDTPESISVPKSGDGPDLSSMPRISTLHVNATGVPKEVRPSSAYPGKFLHIRGRFASPHMKKAMGEERQSVQDPKNYTMTSSSAYPAKGIDIPKIFTVGSIEEQLLEARRMHEATLQNERRLRRRAVTMLSRWSLHAALHRESALVRAGRQRRDRVAMAAHFAVLNAYMLANSRIRRLQEAWARKLCRLLQSAFVEWRAICTPPLHFLDLVFRRYSSERNEQQARRHLAVLAQRRRLREAALAALSVWANRVALRARLSAFAPVIANLHKEKTVRDVLHMLAREVVVTRDISRSAESLRGAALRRLSQRFLAALRAHLRQPVCRLKTFAHFLRSKEERMGWADQGLALLLVSWCVASAATRCQRQALVVRLHVLNRRTVVNAFLALRARILEKTYLHRAKRGAVSLASQRAAQTALLALRLWIRRRRRVTAAANNLRTRAATAAFSAFSAGWGTACACTQGRGGVWAGLLEQWARRCWSGLLEDFAAWQSLTQRAEARRAAELELFMRVRLWILAAALVGLQQEVVHRRARRAADAMCSNFAQVISRRRAGAVLAVLMPLTSRAVRARAITAAIRARHSRAVLGALGKVTSRARNLKFISSEARRTVIAELLSRTWKAWQEVVFCGKNVVPIVFRQRQPSLMRFGFCSLLFALREGSGRRAAAEEWACRGDQRVLDAAFVCLRFLSVNRTAKRFQKVERLQVLCERQQKTSKSVAWNRLQACTLLQEGSKEGKQLHGLNKRRCSAAFRHLVSWTQHSMGLRARAGKLFDAVGSVRSHALTQALRGLARAVAKRAEIRNLKVDLHILASFNFVLQHFDAWTLRTMGSGDACEEERKGLRCLRLAAVRAAEGEIRCCPTTTTSCSLAETSPSCASSTSNDTKIACFLAVPDKRDEIIDSVTCNDAVTSAVTTSKIIKNCDDTLGGAELAQQHLQIRNEKCLRKCIHAWHPLVVYRCNKADCEAQITRKRDHSKLLICYRSWALHCFYVKGLQLTESKIKEISLRSTKNTLRIWFNAARDIPAQISATVQICRTAISKKTAFTYFQEWQETLFLSVYRRKVHTLGLTCLPVSTKKAALTNWFEVMDKRRFHEKHHVSLLMSSIAERSLTLLNSVYLRWIEYSWRSRSLYSFVTTVKLKLRNNVFLAWKQQYLIILRYVQCHEHLRLNRNRFLCHRMFGVWASLSNNDCGILVNHKLAILPCLERYFSTLLNQVAFKWISRNSIMQWACAKALKRTHSVLQTVFLEWVHYARFQSFFFINQETIKKYRIHALLANFIFAWHNLIFVYKRIMLVASKRKLQLLVGALIVWYRFLRIEVMRGQGEAKMCSECVFMWRASVKFEQRIILLQQISAVQRNDQILAQYAGCWIQKFLIAKRQEIISAEVSRRHIVILIRGAMKGWIVSFQHKQYISLIERKISLFGIGTLLSRILSTWGFATRMKAKNHVYFDIYSKLAKAVHTCISSVFLAWMCWSEKEAYFFEVEQRVTQINCQKMLSRYLEHFVNAIIKRKYADHLCAVKENKIRLVYFHKWAQRVTMLQYVDQKYEQAIRLHGALCLLEWNETSRQCSALSTTALKKWLDVIMSSSGSRVISEISANQEVEDEAQSVDEAQSDSNCDHSHDAICLKLTQETEDLLKSVARENPCGPLNYDSSVNHGNLDEDKQLSQDENAVHHENRTDHHDDSLKYHTNSLEPSLLNHNPLGEEGVRDFGELGGVKPDSESESVSSFGSFPTQKAFLDWKMNSIQARFFKTAYRKFISLRKKNACSAWFLWHTEQRILRAHPRHPDTIVSDALSDSDASSINKNTEGGVQTLPCSRSEEFCFISQSKKIQSTQVLGLEHKYWKSTVLSIFRSWKDRAGMIQNLAAAVQSQRTFKLLTSAWSHYRMCMSQTNLKAIKNYKICADPDHTVWLQRRVRVFFAAANKCNDSLSKLGLFCLLCWSLVSKLKEQVARIQNKNSFSNSRRLLVFRFTQWKSGSAECKRNLAQCSNQLIDMRCRRIQDSILSAWLEYQLRMVHRMNVTTILTNKSLSIRIKTTFIAWKRFLQILVSLSTLIHYQNSKWTYFCYWREALQSDAVMPDSDGLSIVSHDICLHPYASSTVFKVGDKLSLWSRWEATNYGHGDTSLHRDTSISSERKTDSFPLNEAAEDVIGHCSHSDGQDHQIDANAYASVSSKPESLNPCVVSDGWESVCPSQGAYPGTMIDDLKRQRAAQRRAQFLQEQYQVQYQDLVPSSNSMMGKSTTDPDAHLNLIDVFDRTERKVDGNSFLPKTKQSNPLKNNEPDIIDNSQPCMIQDFETASFPTSVTQTVVFLKKTETSGHKPALEIDQSRINTALQLHKRHWTFMQHIVLLYWQEHTLVSQQIENALKRINGVLKYKVIVAWMQIRSVQVLSQVAKLKHLDEAKLTAFMRWVHFFRIRRSNCSSSVSSS